MSCPAVPDGDSCSPSLDSQPASAGRRTTGHIHLSTSTEDKLDQMSSSKNCAKMCPNNK